ncbi:hypothetical protein EV175_003059 [Coemansia sp. RSA 1933]|nr:hypothetical protein EV175_003059 [Coemansia sp. RSA 1933]
MSVDWMQYERHSLSTDYSIGVLTQVAIAGLCLSSVVFSVKTIRAYRKYIDADNIAVESPAMFLLPWLAVCDLVSSSMACAALVWPGNARLSSISAESLPGIQRAMNASQICYSLLVTMLSVHILSMAGTISRKIDIHGSGYYGMATLMISCALSHPVFAGKATTVLLCFTAMPLVALVSVVIAAYMARMLHNERRPLVLCIDDSGDIEATVDLGKYASFSARLATLFWLHSLPWFVWTHVHPHACGRILYVVAVLCVCARGVLSISLLRASPAASMRPVGAASRTKYHDDHQE